MTTYEDIKEFNRLRQQASLDNAIAQLRTGVLNHADNGELIQFAKQLVDVVNSHKKVTQQPEVVNDYC